jgi:hypothetical protein
MTASFVVRALLSGIIIALIALIDTGDNALLADHAEATFWYVLPSLPMFLIIPAMLRAGSGFWVALIAGITVTVLLYLITIGIAARFGVRL